MGRRKIAMEKQESQSKRHVTFSKRRVGLFSKAAEMCMVTGAQIAILVSSPSNNPKIFSFGHPSADTVIDTFLTNSSPATSMGDCTKESLRPLYREVKAIEREMKIESATQNEQKKKTSREEWWRSEEYKDWESIEKLQAYAKALEELSNNTRARLESMSLEVQKNH
ncbi:agamous-like MADS-box protein AGL23 [Cornus florida]|uniref:agamous-like MADS-box protein AGL23 n=1 Tax=Cornus florida TaxID=4283 RepID=UPI00289A4EF5|nr:agamous-like MADS-box protein AGL23 [Cornus florida]XP_059645817.1 agamous-like MADS-box protein AGL23 [Cornus florida]